MESEAEIILDDRMILYELSMHHRVAAARRQPLLEELQRMELLGVLQKSWGTDRLNCFQYCGTQ